MPRVGRGAAGAVLVVVVSACGGSALSPAAAHFEGLDPAVVEEVLSNPVARQKIEEAPRAMRASSAQGTVINFMTCRDALRVYEEWRATGAPPAMSPFPEPASPTEPSYSANRQQYEAFSDAVESGEIERLRFVLTTNGSCGSWIPARPGQPDGPTVQDVIEGSS